ncbi:GGDEF domain-containing protein [Streptomyces sp. NPDC003015]
MSSLLRVHGRIGQRTLLLTTAAVPLTGWAVHAVTLHKQLAATKRDPLTGLLRRDAYTARAHRLLARHGGNTALLMVDADHFKAVNDTMGHPAGDAVLMAFGARLTAWAGPRAAVGRLGGADGDRLPHSAAAFLTVEDKGWRAVGSAARSKAGGLRGCAADRQAGTAPTRPPSMTRSWPLM